MMKFSVKIQYGLQALLELALNYGNAPRQMREIASNQKIPLRFLEQLMLPLKKAGLAESTRGVNGGYVLAVHPSDIDLLQVIEALDGRIELIGKRPQKGSVIIEVFGLLQEEFRDKLKKITLDDLVTKKRQKDRAYVYNI